jgi:hypothetical protein
MKLNNKRLQKQKQIHTKKAIAATEATMEIGKKMTDWANEIAFYPGRVARHVWENEFALT